VLGAHWKRSIKLTILQARHRDYQTAYPGLRRKAPAVQLREPVAHVYAEAKRVHMRAKIEVAGEPMTDVKREARERNGDRRLYRVWRACRLKVHSKLRITGINRDSPLQGAQMGAAA
jgi:hypothetical protein